LKSIGCVLRDDDYDTIIMNITTTIMEVKVRMGIVVMGMKGRGNKDKGRGNRKNGEG